MCVSSWPVHPTPTLWSLEVINLVIKVLEVQREVGEGIMALGLLFPYVCSYN